MTVSNDKPEIAVLTEIKGEGKSHNVVKSERKRHCVCILDRGGGEGPYMCEGETERFVISSLLGSFNVIMSQWYNLHFCQHISVSLPVSKCVTGPVCSE